MRNAGTQDREYIYIFLFQSNFKRNPNFYNFIFGKKNCTLVRVPVDYGHYERRGKCTMYVTYNLLVRRRV